MRSLTLPNDLATLIGLASGSTPDDAALRIEHRDQLVHRYFFSASASHGVNHLTASGVGCTPSIRILMPSTLLV